MYKTCRILLNGIIAINALSIPTYAVPNVDASQSTITQTLTSDMISQTELNNDRTANIIRQLRYHDGSLSEINEQSIPIGTKAPSETIIQAFNTNHQLTQFTIKY